MTDIRADQPGDEDRLPWLEAVEDDEGSSGPSALKMIVTLIIALAAIGAIVGGAFWLLERYRGDSGATGEPELIKAPEGDYKVKPDDPGGMDVAGEGETAFQATLGADPKGTINTNGVAEAPVTPGAQPQPQPQPQPPAAVPAGATIQLGAFSSQASAQAAWKALSGRFTYLAPLSHMVVPVTTGGKTLYRLRASGPGAADVCGRLRVAGETCARVD
jgi:hypothetical protein